MVPVPRHLVSGLSRLLVPKPGWKTAATDPIQGPSTVRGPGFGRHAPFHFRPHRPVLRLSQLLLLDGQPGRSAAVPLASAPECGAHTRAVDRLTRCPCAVSDSAPGPGLGGARGLGAGPEGGIVPQTHVLLLCLLLCLPPRLGARLPLLLVALERRPHGTCARCVCVHLATSKWGVVEMVTASQLENDWPADLNVVPGVLGY